MLKQSHSVPRTSFTYCWLVSRVVWSRLSTLDSVSLSIPVRARVQSDSDRSHDLYHLHRHWTNSGPPRTLAGRQGIQEPHPRVQLQEQDETAASGQQ